MNTRVKTGLIMAIVVITMLASRLIYSGLFDLLLGSMAILGCMEISSMKNNKLKENSLEISAFFVPIFYIALQICIIFSIKLWIFVIIEISIIAILFVCSIVQKHIIQKKTASLLTKKEKSKEVYNYGLNTLLNILYPGMFFVVFILINNFEYIANIDSTTVAISYIMLFLVIAVSCFTDIKAYFVGSKLKGKKLAPKISPNKTISGAIGGLIGGTCIAIIIFFILNIIPYFSSAINYFDLAWWHFLLFGFFGSIFNQIGDLYESYLKRKYELKDTGNIFKGHGGMMDRVDGMLFNAVFILIVFLLLLI